MYQWQTIDQNSNIITVGLCSGLLKLVDYLHLVMGDVLFVGDVDVLNMSIVKNKIINVVIVNLAGLVYQGIPRSIQVFLYEPQPFLIGKLHIVKSLNMHTGIGQQCLRC